MKWREYSRRRGNTGPINFVDTYFVPAQTSFARYRNWERLEWYGEILPQKARKFFLTESSVSTKYGIILKILKIREFNFKTFVRLERIGNLF